MGLFQNTHILIYLQNAAMISGEAYINSHEVDPVAHFINDTYY